MSVHRIERTINGSVSVNVGNHNPAKIFLGAAVIALLTWLTLNGTLTGLFASSYCALNEDASFQECCGESGYGSATYFIFQLITGACWLVGTFLTFVWSGLAYLVNDILEGFRQARAEREQTNAVVDQVTQQVVADTMAPDEVSFNTSDPIEELNNRINRRAIASKVQEALNDIQSQIDAIAEHVEYSKPEPPKPVTIEELAAELAELKAAQKPTTRKASSK